jgi:hypothetical protein
LGTAYLLVKRPENLPNWKNVLGNGFMEGPKILALMLETEKILEKEILKRVAFFKKIFTL